VQGSELGLELGVPGHSGFKMLVLATEGAGSWSVEFRFAVFQVILAIESRFDGCLLFLTQQQKITFRSSFCDSLKIDSYFGGGVINFRFRKGMLFCNLELGHEAISPTDVEGRQLSRASCGRKITKPAHNID
jgi:hypothetical protein